MACPPYTPCSQPSDCNPCNDVNPCYENCGCLNPTDWACINNPGTKAALGVENTDNGIDVLTKINLAVDDLQDKSGLVKVDDADTCPETLYDKLEAGTNISITVSGTGCDKKLVITGGVGIGPASADSNVKISGTDTTTGLLNNKIVTGTYLTKSILSPAGNEQLRIDAVPSTFISVPSGGEGANYLSLGLDGKLKVNLPILDGSETKVIQGAGVSVSGSGTLSDPYVVSTNPSIVAKRNCYTGDWKTLTMSTGSVAGVAIANSNVSYRIRFDGSIEFKGSVTYTLTNTFTVANKGIVSIPSAASIVAAEVAGSLPCPTCCNGTKGFLASELARQTNLKSQYYLDASNVIDSAAKFTGYNINMGAGVISVIFYSSVQAASKTIVVSFDGCTYHPDF